MTKDESDMILAYYRTHPEELNAIRREIGAGHPAVRYIEALKLAIKYTEADAQALTDEEDERYQHMARVVAKKRKG